MMIVKGNNIIIIVTTTWEDMHKFDFCEPTGQHHIVMINLE